jgi:hypothetical protein
LWSDLQGPSEGSSRERDDDWREEWMEDMRMHHIGYQLVMVDKMSKDDQTIYLTIVDEVTSYLYPPWLGTCAKGLIYSTCHINIWTSLVSTVVM